MTFKEAREYLEESKKRGSVLGLSNMLTLMEELGNPQNQIPTIHIAGTNGKGSVGAYLSSICKEAGFTAARYCSPAVFDDLECWQYDDRFITEEEYASGMTLIKEACDSISNRISATFAPTSFELETALAFVFASRMKPNVFLLEVGMGGALDATNVVEHPLACVFTKISRDHMQFLGDNLTEIATQKAGIMKPGSFVFWGNQEPEVEAVLKETFARVSKEDSVLGVQTIKGDFYRRCIEVLSYNPGEIQFSYLGVDYETSMTGLYQVENACLAIAVFDAIWPRLLLGLKEDMEYWNAENDSLVSWMEMEYACKTGIAKAHWPGRFEVLGTDPFFVIDGAHNMDAIKQLSKTVENCFTNEPVDFIIGVLKDKEHEKMMEIMAPFANRIYTITPPNERGLDGEILAEEIRMWHEDVVCCKSIQEAVILAMDHAREENCSTLAFGSLSYLSEVKKCHDNYLKSRK